jgi:hypothetical protein
LGSLGKKHQRHEAIVDDSDLDEGRSAIEVIIERQFRSLAWTNGEPADWQAFAADFLRNAALYPAAKPAAPVTVASFIERMKALAQTSLRPFHEAVLGTEVHVFGNIAVAIAAAEMTKNGADTNRNVECCCW